MDEMTRLRELRADAPVPDRGALAPGRRLLTEAAAKGGRGRRFRTDRRIAVVGAVAAVAVGALLTTQVAGGPTDRPGKVAAAPSYPASAAEFLNRAADALEKQEPVPEPRDDQWIYRKGIGPGPVTEVVGGDGERRMTREGPQETEEWVPYGDSAAEKDQSDDDRSVREMYRLVQDLPDDPRQLLAKVRELYPSGKPGDEGYAPETEAEHSVRALGVLIGRTVPPSPDGLAKLYRALATVPGLRIPDRPVTDLAGRPAIAVIHRDAGAFSGGPYDRQFLIDPVTYAVAGERSSLVKGYTEKIPDGYPGSTRTVRHETGEVLFEHTWLRIAVVDEKGQRG